MTDTNPKQRGNRPSSIANQQLPGAMEADDARDDRLFFRFMRNLSDNSEIAARKELGQDSPHCGWGAAGALASQQRRGLQTLRLLARAGSRSSSR